MFNDEGLGAAMAQHALETRIEGLEKKQNELEQFLAQLANLVNEIAQMLK
jgi:hypothetical protein